MPDLGRTYVNTYPFLDHIQTQHFRNRQLIRLPLRPFTRNDVWTFTFIRLVGLPKSREMLGNLQKPKGWKFHSCLVFVHWDLTLNLNLNYLLDQLNVKNSALCKLSCSERLNTPCVSTSFVGLIFQTGSLFWSAYGFQHLSRHLAHQKYVNQDVGVNLWRYVGVQLSVGEGSHMAHNLQSIKVHLRVDRSIVCSRTAGMSEQSCFSCMPRFDSIYGFPFEIRGYYGSANCVGVNKQRVM